MCCGASNSDTAPKDGYYPNENPAVSPYWATHGGPHRYIGIIMVIIMVFLAVGAWATFAKWPRQRVRRWLGMGGRECKCGEGGCKDANCVDVESGGKRWLKELVLKPRPPRAEAEEVKRGRSESSAEGRGQLLEVKGIEHSTSSTTTVANTMLDEKQLFVEESPASHSLSPTTTPTTAATPTSPSQAACTPTMPPPAYTLCRTRARTPYVGSQSQQANGRISRLGWLRRLGTPNSRS